MAKKKTNTKEDLETQLWKSADKLRKNIDAAEYKHVVLGLIFLKYISDAFEELYDKLKAGEGEYAGADPEDKDEYKTENVFFVPEKARWYYLLSQAKQPTIGKSVDEAMDFIEKENGSLKGVLPKVYARQNLDPTSLGELIDMIGNIALGDAKARSADILGHVFEYFLGEFALVEMLQPYKGRVFDPCCGSGGMFVKSEEFVTEHQGKINDISFYGQESNQTTWRLAKMNLAIRGIDSSQVKWNNEGSFLNDAHKDLKADLIDCIVNLPAKLFLNTQIPASLWFMSRDKTAKFPSSGRVSAGWGGQRNRTGEILFIDARNLGHLINRRTKMLSNGIPDPDNNDIQEIASTYHNWRNKFPSDGGVPEGPGGYEDVKGFCASVTKERVAELDYVLTPGRYVGLATEEDDFDFAERFTSLKAEFEAQLKEEYALNKKFISNLSKIKIIHE